MPPVPTPQRRKEKVYIDGRDGFLTYDNKSWDEFTLSFEGHVETDDLDDIRTWLTGQGELIHRDYQDRYFRAEIMNEVSFEKIIGNIYRFIVLFTCQPGAYLLTGKTIQSSTNGTSSFSNIPVSGESHPVIEISGLANTNEITVTGVFTGVPDKILKITPQSTSNITIDTEKEVAYQMNGNEKIALVTTGDFPKAETQKGSNGSIKISPILPISVRPNWRSLP